MTLSATPSLDDALGGALPGRIHLLTGPPGSGKTSACLHFLRAGVFRRERTALVTLDRVADLRSHAAYLGLELPRFVRDGALTLLRYRQRFSARVAETASPEAVSDELRDMLQPAGPKQLPAAKVATRIAVDPVSPFISHADSTGAALAAFVDWLDDAGATAVVTWTGDLTLADRRLEPLVARAAVILRFTRLATTRFRADIVRARHTLAATPSIHFAVLPGLGIVAAPRADAGAAEVPANDDTLTATTALTIPAPPS